MKYQAGHYYHVYNRGCNRERIFACDDNYRYLLSQAKRYLPKASLGVIAYCLMPNHYHFLLRPDSDDAIGCLSSGCSTVTRKPSISGKAAAGPCSKAVLKALRCPTSST